MALRFNEWLDTDRGRVAIYRTDITAIGPEVKLIGLRYKIASVEVSHDMTTIAILPGRDVPQQPF